MKKKIRLSSKNKIIGGVCGGLAEYFNIDATLVRIVCVMLVFILQLLVPVMYVALWAIIPMGDSRSN